MPKIRGSNLTMFAFVLSLWALAAHAQTYPCGCTVSNPSNSSCPSGTYSNQSSPAVCSTATVSCPNANDITVTYSVDTPSSPVVR
jgi:hypothetical protein